MARPNMLAVLRSALRHPCVAALGAWQFRRAFGVRYGSGRRDAYDAGCELAHLLTFRRYDS
jgi:hypothetical protein